MTHEHLIADDDSLFIIDGNTKTVKFQGEDLPTIVQFDHLSEIMTFSMPRYVEGHDMKLCNVVQIHFVNISADGRNKTASFSVIEELAEGKDDELHFCWSIPSDATQYAGSLNFVITFKCVDTESNVINYRWNTELNDDLVVRSGMDNTVQWMGGQIDFLEQWKKSVIAECKNPDIDIDPDTLGAVLYSEQTLTEAEKAQARKNIGVDMSKLSLPTPENFCFSKITSDIATNTHHITYGNGRFVMLGSYEGDPVAVITTDFVNFKHVACPGGGNNLKFLNGKFIITTTSSIKYSDDAETWTEVELPVSGDWNDIAYGNGFYVIVGGDYVDAETNISLYSMDLVNWYQAIMPVVDAWHSVEYGNGWFVAINYTGDHLAVFTMDPPRWTDCHGFGNGLFFNIYFNDGKFYIPIAPSDLGGTTNEILVGNPLEFERKKLPVAAHWQTMAFGAGYGIVFAHSADGFTETTDACYTTDGGETWEHIVLPKKSRRYYSAYGKGIFACLAGYWVEFCNLVDNL